MLIDYDNKAIFVHIPKTAGISVTACLKYYLGSSIDLERSIHSYSLDTSFSHLLDVTNITEHSGVNDIIAGGFPKVKDINQYFVYTIVRNPWSQLLSYYNFFRMIELKGFDITFESFIQQLPEYTYTSPSYYGFIYDSRGYKRVNEIVYLEDLNNQWKQKIHNNLPMYPEKVNSSLNMSQELFHDYRFHYTEEMVDIVSEQRAKDIEIFGYTFEGGPTAVPDVSIPERIEPYDAKINWVTDGETINEQNAVAHGIILTSTLKKMYRAVETQK